LQENEIRSYFGIQDLISQKNVYFVGWGPLQRGEALQLLHEFFKNCGETLAIDFVSLQSPELHASDSEIEDYELRIKATLEASTSENLKRIVENRGLIMKELKSGYWLICSPKRQLLKNI
jgi:hypothetical protein